jgi:hypothetical protein
MLDVYPVSVVAVSDVWTAPVELSVSSLVGTLITAEYPEVEAVLRSLVPTFTALVLTVIPAEPP